MDAVWGFVAGIAFPGPRGSEKTWAIINTITAGLLVLISIFGPLLAGGWGNAMIVSVFVICFIRTIFDYYVCWDFYYPGDDP
jgi:hypothetical protein